MSAQWKDQIDTWVLSKQIADLTQMDRCGCTVDTINGPMKYIEWCEREAKRLSGNKPGRIVRVKRGEKTLPTGVVDPYCCLEGHYYIPCSANGQPIRTSDRERSKK